MDDFTKDALTTYIILVVGIFLAIFFIIVRLAVALGVENMLHASFRLGG